MNAAANTPNPWPTVPRDLHEAIRCRAEEIYIRNGKLPGRDLENWAQAEQEIRREFADRPHRRTAIVVRVNGAEYIGEYTIPNPATVMLPANSARVPPSPSASMATRCS